MLSIAAMAAGNEKYYTRLAAEDYYLEGGEQPGRWWGKGAERLGLTGEVSAHALRSLLSGFSPDGKPLIQNAGSPKHQAGTDGTFSLWKDASVLWLFGDRKQRWHIEESHRLGVEAGLSYLQDDVAVSRMGQGGKRRVPADLVVATFFHLTSRAGDPQLHTHCLVLNVCVRPDGSTGTIVSRPLYENKMVAGALYRATVAAELQRRLQLVIERTDKSFRIVGVPEELVRHFSKRREQIRERLAQRDENSAKAAAIAALDTRKAKTETPSREELINRWRAEAAALGFAKIDAFEQHQTERVSKPKPDLNRLIGEAVKERAEGSGYFSRGWLLRRVASESTGHGFDAKDIREGVDRAVWGQPGILRFFQMLKLMGVRRAFRVEKRAVRLSHKLQAAGVHGADNETVSAALSRHSRPRNEKREITVQYIRQFGRAFLKKRGDVSPSRAKKRLARRVLTAQERSLVRQITAKRRGSLRLIQCKGERARTQVIRASREILEKSRYRVIVSAASRKRAKELGRLVGAESFTFGGLERQLRPLLAKRINRAGKKVSNALRGRANHRSNRFRMNGKTAILVDNAASLNTRRFKLLLKAAKAAGALVVLLDSKKRQSRPFGMFRTLVAKQQYDTTPEPSTTITRISSRTRDASESQMIFDWFGCQSRHSGATVIISKDVDDAERHNRLCQAERVRLGELRGTCITMKDRRFFEGDRVHFVQAEQTLGISGGETGLIVRLSPAKQSVVVRLDGGGHVAIPLEACPALRHGYALPVGVRHQRQLTDVLSLGELDNPAFANTVGPNDTPSIRAYVTEASKREEAYAHGPKLEKATQHQQGYSL